jgi:hypothetical protein
MLEVPSRLLATMAMTVVSRLLLLVLRPGLVFAPNVCRGTGRSNV